VARLDPPARVAVSLLWRAGALGAVAADFLTVAQALHADDVL
jgi:hypothetical protein